MKTQAIIPAAGLGERFGSDIPKPLIQLGDKPIIIQTLKNLSACSLIDSFILVVNEAFMPQYKELVETNAINNVKKIIIGGATRFESVHQGLLATDEDTEAVLVHDGARPIIAKNIVEAAIKVCEDHQAAVVGVPLKNTIKKVHPDDLVVQKTLNRNELWEIQTPQVFKKQTLLKAHQAVKDGDPTDDALLVEEMGVDVKVVCGDYKNIKITTPEDLVIAGIFLNDS